MCKILIIGPPCAGKSYLANVLSSKLKIEKFELDDYFWTENWTRQSSDVFKEYVMNITNKSEWIIDGYYNDVSELLDENAEIVIVILKPLVILLFRLLTRSTHRILNKTKVCGNNVESLPFLFSSAGMIRYTWTQYLRYKSNWYERTFDKDKLIVINTERDILRLFDRLHINIES